MLYVSKLIEEKELTNSTDDGGPAEVFGRIVLGIELGQPLDVTAGKMFSSECELRPKDAYDVHAILYITLQSQPSTEQRFQNARVRQSCLERF